jgi:molybdenum cofactor cytidylyltransferase
MTESNEIWAIVLAAGASTRMKTQKLLLPFNGKSMIETVLDNVALSIGKNIIVVLGSHRNEIRKVIGNRQVCFCVNENFMDGMLSSVICGFSALPKSAKAVLLFLGDQPNIPHAVTDKVVKAWRRNNKGIVIPTFNSRRGHPGLFEIKYITEIGKLDPTKGLRTLSERYKNDVLEVECNFPAILKDIDTPEEYQMEINKN